jgi:hypothetical protein
MICSRHVPQFASRTNPSGGGSDGLVPSRGELASTFQIFGLEFFAAFFRPDRCDQNQG